MCRRSFCSVASKQMSYLESSSFALVAMEQRGNEKPLTAQCWLYLISQFTLCFAGSVGTIPLCIFKSSCHMLHQHSADPDMLSVVKIHIFLSYRGRVKIDTQAVGVQHSFSEITNTKWRRWETPAAQGTDRSFFLPNLQTLRENRRL